MGNLPLIPLLASFLFGLAWFALLASGGIGAILVAIVAAFIVLLRHLGDWLVYAIGIIVAVLLSLIAPQVGWPADGAAVVVVVGALLKEW